MSINFPNSPSNGQVYTIGSRSWTWSNTYGLWQATSATTGYTGSAGVGYTGSQGSIGYTGSTATGNTTITSNSELFTANGSTNTFTLSTSTYSNTTVMVTLNGLLLTPADHYNITGSSLSFVVTPANNDYIEVRSLSGYGAIGYTGSAGSGATTSTDDIISLNLMFGLL